MSLTSRRLSQRCTLLVFGLLLAVNAGAQSPWTLLTEGQFHDGDVTAETGSGWLALMSTRDGFRLERVTISVDTIVEVDKRGPAWRVVSIQCRAEQDYSIFVLKGLDKLTEGPVETVFVGELSLLPDGLFRVGPSGKPLTREQRSETRLLGFGEFESLPDGRIVRNYRLELHTSTYSDRGPNHDGKEQDIINAEREGWADGLVDKLPQVLWIGDIDHDGVYDYLIDKSTSGSGGRRMVLFVSSAAGDKQIVAPVAEFIVTGC